MTASVMSALQQWMVQQGCLVHPSLEIPALIDGVQGVAARSNIPPYTLILAIPSHLILTVSRCYRDAPLYKLFLHNDDLFDYEATEDAQFNVLCVFLMYHRLNLASSPWQQYIGSISQPQTAVDWSMQHLQGLPRSMVEQIIHVRRECSSLQTTLVKYLLTRKQFPHSEAVLRREFQYCYRATMTRCFGYYFKQASLIPVVDLINHNCQAVDHQLLHLKYELNPTLAHKAYVSRRDKIDCSLLLLQKCAAAMPKREQILLEMNIIKQTQLPHLNRQKIDFYFQQINQQIILNTPIDQLNFYSEPDSEDNDTQEEQQQQREQEYRMLRQSQEYQFQEFIKSNVVIQPYKSIQNQLIHQGYMQQKEQLINKIEEVQTNQYKNITQQIPNIVSNSTSLNINQINEGQNKVTQQQAQSIKSKQPIIKQQISSCSQQQDQQYQSDESDKWGLQQGAYFTISTTSAVAAGAQLFNSYGCRSNRFLLIWYGFAYCDNLYDSVSFRLHAQFGRLRPGNEMVLDTYVGGHGLAFRKSSNEVVKPQQVSKEFRLKRSKINLRLLAYLRLFLLQFYPHPVATLFITFPANIAYQIYVFQYYKQIINGLYQWYPIHQFLLDSPQNKYKHVFITEQRKILDAQSQAVQFILQILKKCVQTPITKAFYTHLPIKIIKKIKNYIIQLQKCTKYICHNQIHLQQSVISNNKQ